ncbi:MAG: DUF4097 family beta strand repeat protein [Deltaproteobacteria bacterium]|nr:DUF4097 family beta strand repeat protein [Deltaproteobacteria bacterium]
MTRTHTLPLALVALGACTLNVQPVDHRVSARTTDDVRGLSSDLRALALDDVEVLIGPTADDPTASVHITGLLAFDRSIDDLVSGMVIAFDASDPDATSLRYTAAALEAETVHVDALELALGEGTALDLTTTRGSIELTGLHAPARLHATSGSIDVEDATEVDLRATSGSIRVIATQGTLQCDSGSIDMEMTGPVMARATSGSIRGTFDGGGTLSADSGSLDLVLLGPLDRDLVLEADSGSIDLVVPDDLAARVEANADSGGVDVHVGATDAGDGHSFVGDLNGGGTFVIRATTSSGSIRISSRRAD